MSSSYKLQPTGDGLYIVTKFNALIFKHIRVSEEAMTYQECNAFILNANNGK